jgi:structural maintenance of chromosome 2
MNAANKICSLIKIRTVTLDGDEYDPSGTISGGSRNNLGSTLSRLSDLDTTSSKLSELKIQLKKLNLNLDNMTTVSNNHEALIASSNSAERAS